MLLTLALRNLALRRWRTAFLLVGYGMGVSVMIVLLSVGQALLTQARDERLVGGGQVTVLPEGIDLEVMKTGGLGGMFFSIDHARFIDRQLLAAPRLSPFVRSVAPQIDGKLMYFRTSAGREIPVLASGEIPSRSRGVGVPADLTVGAWDDDSADTEWRDPSLAQLRHEIDHFHLPPPEVLGDPSWAEWHYFNALWPDGKTWAFISFMVAGAVPNGRWGGQLLITLHEQGRPARRFTATTAPSGVRFSTTSADLTLGASSVTVLADGRYAVRAYATEDGTGTLMTVELTIAPSTGAYFPGAALGGEQMVSGYVVPALRAEATGKVCVAGHCEELNGVQAYHDHNWGTWRGVTWEWGAARAGSFTLLYGRVQPADTASAHQPLFVYLVDSLGFLALFRPQTIDYQDARVVVIEGHELHVPAQATMVDVRGDDTLRVEMTIDDATATDTRSPAVERGEANGARALTHPYFVQMKGTMRMSGRVAGRVISGAGVGFFETYR